MHGSVLGSVAANTEKKKKSKKKNGGRGRTTEAEEDAALLKTAQSKVRVVRLTKQPACLWKKCEMRDYQLEGLNWLIKLHGTYFRHNGVLVREQCPMFAFFSYCCSSRCPLLKDHDINGILADEMGLGVRNERQSLFSFFILGLYF